MIDQRLVCRQCLLVLMTIGPLGRLAELCLGVVSAAVYLELWYLQVNYVRTFNGSTSHFYMVFGTNFSQCLLKTFTKLLE